MERRIFTRLLGFSLILFLTDCLTSVCANQPDAEQIGNTVWACTVETVNKTLYSSYSTDIQCRYRSDYDTCLGSKLTSRTVQMRQYNKDLDKSCTQPAERATDQGLKCVKSYEKNINNWGCLTKIQKVMQGAKTSTLTLADQKKYYCEALLLTAECFGRNVISYCNLDGLDLYTSYFTLSKIEAECKTALGRSTDDVNINIGGHDHTGGDFNIDDFFSNDPLFHITPFPTGSLAQTGHPGTGNQSNVVSGPEGSACAVTAVWLHIAGSLFLTMLIVV